MDERQRLEALANSVLRDTTPDAAFDELVRVAAALCQTPAAALSVVGADQQWFKASVGLAEDAVPREWSFCARAIEEPTHRLVVRDALEDPRFADNPQVVGAPHIRFYAGQRVHGQGGAALGALCVIDTEPRDLSQQQLDGLAALTRQVEALIEARWMAGRLDRMTAQLNELRAVSR